MARGGPAGAGVRGLHPNDTLGPPRKGRPLLFRPGCALSGADPVAIRGPGKWNSELRAASRGAAFSLPEEGARAGPRPRRERTPPLLRAPGGREGNDRDGIAGRPDRPPRSP